MEYKIIYGESMDEVEKKANALMKDGWLPEGGLAIHMGIMILPQ